MERRILAIVTIALVLGVLWQAIRIGGAAYTKTFAARTITVPTACTRPAPLPSGSGIYSPANMSMAWAAEADAMFACARSAKGETRVQALLRGTYDDAQSAQYALRANEPFKSLGAARVRAAQGLIEDLFRRSRLSGRQREDAGWLRQYLSQLQSAF